MNSGKSKSIIQIQPRYTEREEYEAIALQEGLSYEALEMSSPPVLGDDALMDDCRKWYTAGRRTTSVHGAFIDVNPASSDESFRILSRRRCLDSCLLARDLGAEHVVFHSSCAPFLRGSYMDYWAGMCAAYYEELAEASGIHIWVENSQDVDAVPLRELMKHISDPRIGVCLDLGHVHFSRMPVEQWFESLGEWVGYLHLSDNNGQYDEHLPLGEGGVDWKAAEAFWRSAGRTMPVTLEVGDAEGIRRSIRYLKEHGYFGMN